MKVKILQGFGDKYNGTVYVAGQVIDFDAKRAKELIADPRGLVEAIEEPEQAASVPDEPVKTAPKRKRSVKK